MNKILNKYYFFNFLFVMMVSFFNPILYLFLLISFSVQEIGLYLSFFWLFSFLTEIPCGAITDVIGEKKSLYLSFFVRMCGLFLLLLENFWLLLFSAVLSAISESFQSGTISSWMINSLKSNGCDGSIEYEKIFSRNSLIGMTTSLIVGYLAAEYLFVYQPTLPIFFSLFTCMIQLIFIMSIDDYKIRSNYNYRITLKESAKELKSVLGGLLGAKMGLILMTLILLPSILDLGPSNQWQAVFFDKNNPSLTGYIWIVITMSGMLGSLISSKISKHLKSNKVFLVLIYFNVFLVVLMSLNIDMYIRIALFSTHIIVNTICGIKGMSLLHQEIVENDRFRNTTVSIYFSFEAIVTSGMLAINGYSSAQIGIKKTWIVTSVLVFIIVTLGSLYVTNKNQGCGRREN